MLKIIHLSVEIKMLLQQSANIMVCDHEARIPWYNTKPFQAPIQRWCPTKAEEGKSKLPMK
jgi:hypothetical protein